MIMAKKKAKKKDDGSMRAYSVRRYWEMYDTVEVLACSKEKAIESAMEEDVCDGDYVCDSLNIDEGVDVQVYDTKKKTYVRA
jgi:hypothetical protein